MLRTYSRCDSRLSESTIKRLFESSLREKEPLIKRDHDDDSNYKSETA